MAFNVLITGHCGYIGSALMVYLKDALFINKLIGYDIVEGDDIMDYSNLVNKLMVHDIDVVIHLAAVSSVSACNDQPKLAIKINAIGTRNVLRAMRSARTKHIIYASTSSVYGDNIPDKGYKENNPLNPCSAYGSSKLLGEQVIFDHYHINNYQGNYLIFRMFNVVGTSGYPKIDSMSNPGYDRIFGALQSGNITIYGNDYKTSDGTCERDYISLKDVCQAYLLGIKAFFLSDNVRSVINICSGTPISVKALIIKWNRIQQKLKHTSIVGLGSLSKVKYEYGRKRRGDPKTVYGSNLKANKIIKWRPLRIIENIIFDIAKDKYHVKQFLLY